MILIEQTQVPDVALPVAEFREHLQLGSGFADDGFQDSVLLDALRAAIATIEGKTSKALISRDFVLVISAWRDLGQQALPIAPVSAVQSLSIVDANDTSTPVDPGAYRLKADAHAPHVKSLSLSFPTIPVGGSADLAFAAGFGAWGDVPADLRQAVFLLATHYYETRGAAGNRTTQMPLSVAGICRRHAPIRLVGARRI